MSVPAGKKSRDKPKLPAERSDGFPGKVWDTVSSAGRIALETASTVGNSAINYIIDNAVTPESKLFKEVMKLRIDLDKYLGEMFGVDGYDGVFPASGGSREIKYARKKSNRYVRYSRKIFMLPHLDVISTARWLDLVIKLLKAFETPLSNLKNNKHNGEIPQNYDRMRRNLLSRANKMDRLPEISRGKQQALKIDKNLEQKAFRSGLKIVYSQALDDTIGMSHDEIERVRVRLKVELVGYNNDRRIQVVETMLKALHEADLRLSTPAQTPFAHLQALLDYTEKQSNEESQAEIINGDINIDDLTRLAKDKVQRERLANLGIQFTDESFFEFTAEAVSSIFGADPLAHIATGRFDQERAIKRLSSALAIAGGPPTTIKVPDISSIVHIKVDINSDGNIKIEKSKYLQGIERADPKNPDKDPQGSWTLKPGELVKLIDASSGETITLPAFAILHMKKKAFKDTITLWIAFAEMGVSGVIKSAKSARALSSDLPNTSSVGSDASASIVTPSTRPRDAKGRYVRTVDDPTIKKSTTSIGSDSILPKMPSPSHVHGAYNGSTALARGNSGEHLATWWLVDEGHSLLSWKPDISDTNLPGIDIVTFKDSRVFLVDNKALSRSGKISSVSALTRNLEKNKKTVLAGLITISKRSNLSNEQKILYDNAIKAMKEDKVTLVVTNANIAKDGNTTTGITDKLKEKGISFIDVFRSNKSKQISKELIKQEKFNKKANKLADEILDQQNEQEYFREKAAELVDEILDQQNEQEYFREKAAELVDEILGPLELETKQAIPSKKTQN